MLDPEFTLSLHVDPTRDYSPEEWGEIITKAERALELVGARGRVRTSARGGRSGELIGLVGPTPKLRILKGLTCFLQSVRAIGRTPRTHTTFGAAFVFNRAQCGECHRDVSHAVHQRER